MTQRIRQRLIAGFGTTVLLLGIAQPAASQYKLDLTGDQVVPQGRDQGTPTVMMLPGGGSGENAAPLPLELTVVYLSSSRLARGDVLVFEVMLRNVGTTPVELPWEPHPPDRVHLDKNQQELHLVMTAQGRDGKRHALTSQILRGVPFSRSLLTLQPNEFATIRARGEIQFDPSLVVLNPRETDIRFGARILMRARRGTETVLSPPISATLQPKANK